MSNDDALLVWVDNEVEMAEQDGCPDEAEKFRAIAARLRELEEWKSSIVESRNVALDVMNKAEAARMKDIEEEARLREPSVPLDVVEGLVQSLTLLEDRTTSHVCGYTYEQSCDCNCEQCKKRRTALAAYDRWQKGPSDG